MVRVSGLAIAYNPSSPTLLNATHLAVVSDNLEPVVSLLDCLTKPRCRLEVLPHGGEGIKARYATPSVAGSETERVSGLTRTESLIVAAYMSRDPPPKAKELASRLGVSVRTVYKAIYKYRRICRELGIEPLAVFRQRGGRSRRRLEEATAGEVRRWLNEVLGEPSSRALLSEIQALRMSVESLTESINKLIRLLESQKPPVEEDQLEVPSFIKDNPWLDVLRSRH